MQHFLYLLILFGSFQGIITGSLLFFSKNRSISCKILAWIIWLIALPGIHLYLHSIDWYDSGKWAEVVHGIIPLVLFMPIGPLIFFYIRSLLEADFTITPKEKKHFIPVIIDLLPYMLSIIYLSGVALGWVAPDKKSMSFIINTYSQYADIPRWLSLSLYLLFSFRYLRDDRINKEIAATDFKWLTIFIRVFALFQVIWFIYMVPYIIPRYSQWWVDTVGWFPVYIPMAVLIYWLGIKGYQLSHVQVATGKKNNDRTRPLHGTNAEETIARLKKAMEEEQLFLNAALNLSMVSAHTGLQAKLISSVLNNYAQVTFNEFVNRYRIEEFKKRFTDPVNDSLTIIGLASECGFSSAATFQRSFKQFTGLSPSEFRKSAK